MRAQNDREGEPEPCHCAPCSSSRAGAAPTPLIVVGIVAINYIPNVLWSLEVNGASGGAVVAVIFFHFFVGLMVLAWAYTCFTDPGVPPERWQRQMAALAQAGQEVKVCRKSGLYKPARAHYCSVTRRLTLNMDHFCPWVVNTVGFYNKKFFVLFLLYACAAVAYSLAAIASQAAALFGFAKELGDDDDRWLPGALNLVLLVGAMVLDVVLLLVLGPFLAFHLKMAAKNQTTIDGDRYPQYELEVERNLQSVLGRRARRGRARRPRASLLARISTLRRVLFPPPSPHLLLSCHLSVTSRLSPAALPAPLFSLALSLSLRAGSAGRGCCRATAPAPTATASIGRRARAAARARATTCRTASPAAPRSASRQAVAAARRPCLGRRPPRSLWTPARAAVAMAPRQPGTWVAVALVAATWRWEAGSLQTPDSRPRGVT